MPRESRHNGATQQKRYDSTKIARLKKKRHARQKRRDSTKKERINKKGATRQKKARLDKKGATRQKKARLDKKGATRQKRHVVKPVLYYNLIQIIVQTIFLFIL